jgi:DNA polymerase III epsilon subunit family exonuclease
MTGGTIHISKEFYRMVKPEGEMTNKNIEIHGITPGELEKKENIDAVLPDFLNFIRDSVIVGHFVNFDIDFINTALKKVYGSRLANLAVDTHTLHEWLYENSSKFKKHYRGGSVKTDLFSVAGRYGITIDSAHNALNDAFVTAQLFQRFLYFLDAEGVQTVGELLDIGRA